MVRDLEWPGEGVDPSPVVAKHLGLEGSEVRAVVMVKRSLDARQRTKRWWAVYRVDVLPEHEAKVLARPPKGVRVWNARDEGRYGLVDGTPRRLRWPPDVRPVVVGAGPAGLFAALYLAEAGARVLLLERGGPVKERVLAVNNFWRGKGSLDPENNLLFGEGGAGTFSDGKIYTRRRDGELGYIFRRFIDFGASPEILTESYAHLGTDRIRAVLPVFRRRLQELGVEVRYHAQVQDFLVEAGRCVGVRLHGGEEIVAGPVVVATGHSARDTAAAMVHAGAQAEARGVAIGVRIEHPQALIDRARYRTTARGDLPPASYRLAFHPSQGLPGRTFCMCPGGMIVPASNHPERVVVNGMSFAARRARWANSAVIVEVPVEAFGASDPLAGFRWQDAIESKCYQAAGADYRAPGQRVVDLLSGRDSVELPPTSFPMGVTPGNLFDVMPELVVRGLIDSLKAFDEELPGFVGPEATLVAPETRTTAPLKFRRFKSCESRTLPGLYPAGEGAGYAGGIISSALDGLRAARGICAAHGLMHVRSSTGAVDKAVDN